MAEILPSPTLNCHDHQDLSHLDQPASSLHFNVMVIVAAMLCASLCSRPPLHAALCVSMHPPCPSQASRMGCFPETEFQHENEGDGVSSYSDFLEFTLLPRLLCHLFGGLC
ncbi:hypothetical protein Dsin_028577 [Dipteronia sinensis]|uniref:Uncharacterized protein n=1 Tax=Dipteronia sinensis TaxID=43782 RepID=A0AAD9ZSB5_9ROSI|nr:hypothetical protein Dsin_028577 [Dipteronia sinensis]